MFPSINSFRLLLVAASPVGAGIPFRDSASIKLIFGSPDGGRGVSAKGEIIALLALFIAALFDWACAIEGFRKAVKERQKINLSNFTEECMYTLL